MLCDKKIRHFRLVEPKTNTKAGDPWLGDLEFGVPDAVAVADTHFGVGEAGNGEVLPEVARSQIVAIQIGLPEVVRLGLIHHDCALFPAVAAQVTLAVTVDVEPAHHDRALDGGLPNPGVDGFIAPLHVLGHAHIDRNKGAHCVSLGAKTSRNSLNQWFAAVDPQRHTGHEGVGQREQHRTRHIFWGSYPTRTVLSCKGLPTRSPPPSRFQMGTAGPEYSQLTMRSTRADALAGSGFWCILG